MDDLSRVNRAMVENVSTGRVWKPPSKRKLGDRKQKHQSRERGEKEEEGKNLAMDKQGLTLGKQLVVYKIKTRPGSHREGQEGEERTTKKIDIFI